MHPVSPGFFHPAGYIRIIGKAPDESSFKANSPFPFEEIAISSASDKDFLRIFFYPAFMRADRNQAT